jgi:hypothetical protein
MHSPGNNAHLTGVTKMATPAAVEVQAKSTREQELEQKQKDADAKNKALTGVGMRYRVGQTRGKNPLVIEWLAFDESLPETLPTTMKQFMEITGKSEEGTLVDFLIRGINAANYEASSDPLAEYVEATWPEDAQTQFRLVVRNYARGAQVSLDSAVELIKPGFVKQFGPK